MKRIVHNLLHDFNGLYGVVRALLNDARSGYELTEEDYQDGFDVLDDFKTVLELINLAYSDFEQAHLEKYVVIDGEAPEEALPALALAVAAWQVGKIEIDDEIRLVDFDTNISQSSIRRLAKEEIEGWVLEGDILRELS